MTEFKDIYDALAGIAIMLSNIEAKLDSMRAWKTPPPFTTPEGEIIFPLRKIPVWTGKATIGRPKKFSTDEERKAAIKARRKIRDAQKRLKAKAELIFEAAAAMEDVANISVVS